MVNIIIFHKVDMFSGEGNLELFWRKEQIQTDIDFDVPRPGSRVEYPVVQISKDPEGYSKR